jgi:hypothetical protein
VNGYARLRTAERWMAKTPDVVLHMKCLRGNSPEKVLRAVRSALVPKSVPILEEILRQAEEYETKYRNGRGKYGFLLWLDYLQTGLAALPDVIPDEVLRFWRDDHKRQPAELDPCPAVRCLRCGMVLPGSVPEPGWPYSGTWRRCPVCGADDMAGRDWSPGEGHVWMKGKRRYAIRNCVAVPE